MENSAEKLYNILGTKFDNTDIKTLTSTGKETTEMEEIKMFSFDFLMDNKNYGPVVILISAEDNLEVYYGDNTSKSLDRNAKKKWENLIEHLSTFARTNRLGFSLKHTTDLKYDLSNIADITEAYKHIFEGYYGTRKTSYNKQGKAKIIIKHSRSLGEDEKRYRNISQLFIENADGERFKLPFTKLTGARAMARHVTEGGNPYDLFGVHICEMVKDINTLGGFVRRSKMFEDDEATSGLVETGRTHYKAMQKGLKQIAGKRGYHTFKESWKPEQITEQDIDTDTIRSKFTERSVNRRVEEALPLLARLQKMAEDVTADEYAKSGVWNESADELDEATAMNNNWFDSLNQALEAEGLTSAWDGMTMGGINYGETKSWNARNDAGQCEHISIYRETDGRYERPVHYASKMCATNESVQVTEFEQWADQIVESPSSPIDELEKFFTKEQPLGIDAMNVADTIEQSIGSAELDSLLVHAASKDAEQDARLIVRDWISKNKINLAHKLNLQGEYDNPLARDFPREGLETELDADNDTQINASVNKDNDKYINKDKSVTEDEEWGEPLDFDDDFEDKVLDAYENGSLTFTQAEHKLKKYYTDPQDIYMAMSALNAIDESKQFNETGDNMNKLFTEYVAEAEAATEVDEAEEIEEEVIDEADEVVEEDTIELEEAHDGPIVAMSNGDDLGALMQRTNHLLKK